MVVGELTTAVDLLVLGAGADGRAAALRAAQLGREVVLVDPHLPAHEAEDSIQLYAETLQQALLTATGQWRQSQQLGHLGLSTGSTIDFAQLQRWKEALLRQEADQFNGQLTALGVETVRGAGRFVQPHEVRVESSQGVNRLHFEHCIIAAGGQPQPLPNAPFDDSRILKPAQALLRAEWREQVVVVGAAPAAIELSILLARLEVDVTLATPGDQPLLAGFDDALLPLLVQQLNKLGIEQLTVEQPLGQWVQRLPAAATVVVCLGDKPNSAQLDLAQAGVTCSAEGFVQVNAQLQSSNPRIYAIGGVTAADLSTAESAKQAYTAADHAAGRVVAYAPQAVPRFVQSWPPLAATGVTARQARALGYGVHEVRLELVDPLAAANESEQAPQGVLLLTAEAESGILLGVACMAPDAAGLIGEAALALEMGATLYDWQETLHPTGSSASVLNEMELEQTQLLIEKGKCNF